ncbi:hypothetical protein XENTR_v10019858 [Xenopus tropicalis]|nr:hypothetical protein XENTR_v10019858 [Xenopus tropicalis]
MVGNGGSSQPAYFLAPPAEMRPPRISMRMSQTNCKDSRRLWHWGSTAASGSPRGPGTLLLNGAGRARDHGKVCDTGGVCVLY